MEITVKIDAPIEAAQSVKECLGMHLEWIGSIRIISIKDDGYNEQLKMKG